MDVAEIKATVDQLGRAWEEFKQANDARLEQFEKKGTADALLGEKLGKITVDLDALQAKMTEEVKRADDIEKRVNRPGGLGAGGDKAMAELKAFNIALKSHAAIFSRPTPNELADEDYAAYKQHFGSWLRKGDQSLYEAERKAMSVGSDPDGGYLVPENVSGRMVSKVYETSMMRRIASIIQISTDALEGPIDNAEAGAGWVGETQSRPATSTPTLGKWRIPVHEMYAMPEATQTLLDDAAINVEDWLANKVAEKFGRLEETAFVAGDGLGKPRGFLAYTTAATPDATRAWGVIEHIATGTSGGYGTAPNGSDKLIDLVHALKAAYRNGARWVMNRSVLGTTRQLKANGEYIWLPSLSANQEATLLGYPISEFEDMPALAANSLSIAFGNFAIGYQIVDRQGIRTLRDPYTNKPYVRFYTTQRVGGDVLNFEAIKVLKFI